MTTFKRNPLNSSYFIINGSNLERLNLFNKSVKIMYIDPTVTGPSTTLNATQKENLSVTTSDNISVVAANYLNSAWTSAGWNVSSMANLTAGLDTWAANNLAGDHNIVRMQGSINGNDYTLCFCYPGNQTEFYLSENFNRSNSSTIGNGWSQIVNSGTMVIYNNQLKFEDSGNAQACIYRNDFAYNFTNVPCYIQFTIRRASNHYFGRMGVVFGGSSGTENFGGTKTGLCVQTNDGDNGWWLRDNSGDLGDTYIQTLNADTDYTVRMEIISSRRVKVNVNGTYIYDYTKSSDFSLTGNYLKFGTGLMANQVYATIDNITVQAGLY